MDKRETRRAFCVLRECLPPEEVAAASEALCQQLATWPLLREDSTVLTYLAFRSEPDLGLLFSLRPDVRWIVPRIAQRQIFLHPYDPARLVRHRYGMLEPAADLPLVDPAALDVVLVPGVAFDRQGRRMGLGGGYYDRFLPTTPALRVGVAYDCSLTDELPCDERDQHVDWVITPTQIIHCRPPEKRCADY